MMKRCMLLGAGSMALLGWAHAQSQLSISGITDAGVNYINVKDNCSAVSNCGFNIDSGLQNASRLIFRGSEDLGNGLKAIFVLDHRPTIDTGSYSLSTWYGGQSVVGLSSNRWGTVTLGRNMNVGLRYSAQVSPFGVSHGTANVASVFGYNDSDFGSGRSNNSAYYVSPKMAGLELVLGYSLQVSSTEATGDNNDRLLDLGGRYDRGPLTVIAYYQRLDPSDGTANQGTMTNFAVGGNYRISDFTLYAGLSKTRNIRTVSAYNRLNSFVTGATSADFTDDQAETVGVSYKFDRSRVYGAYQRAEDSKVNGWALGYTYNLSKRTALYAYTANYRVYSWNQKHYVTMNQVAMGMSHSF